MTNLLLINKGSLRSILALSLLLVVGCSPTEWEDLNASNVRGYVFDSSNNPIENANIYIGYTFIIDRPSTTINFSVPQESNVRIWISSECEDTVNVLTDTLYYAGNHSIIWNADDTNGQLLLDGSYIVNMEADGYLGSFTSFLSSVNETYQGCDYFRGCITAAITDSDGYFEFSQNCLSFNTSFMGTDEFGNETGMHTTPSQLRLFVEKEEYIESEGIIVKVNKLTDFFDVDSVNGAEIVINLDD